MNTMQTIFTPLSQQISNYITQSKRKAVAQSAVVAVTTRYAEWEDVGFDEHFLTHSGASVMDEYYRSGQLPRAEALADAWSNQFFWLDATKKDVQKRFMPIAQDFVYILSTAPIHAAPRFALKQRSCHDSVTVNTQSVIVVS